MRAEHTTCSPHEDHTPCFRSPECREQPLHARFLRRSTCPSAATAPACDRPRAQCGPARSLGNADDLLPVIYPFPLFCLIVRPLSFTHSFQGSTDFQTANCSMPFHVIPSFRSLDTFWPHHGCQTIDPLPNLLPQVSQPLTTTRAFLRQLFPLSVMHHS